MSILHLNQIEKYISSKFKGLIDLTDQGSSAEHFLTRALSAYSIHILAESNKEEAAKSVTDGGNDNGIDAIYYDKQNSRLYLVQSKWIKNGKGQPSLGEIQKFKQGITDLFNFRFDRFNNKISERQDEIKSAINQHTTKYSIVVNYTGINKLAKPATEVLNDFIIELNDASEIVELEVLKQTELHNSLTASLNGNPINESLTLKSWGTLDDPYRAYYGQISAKQIAKLWNQYHNRLFVKNLRNILGDTEINNEIRYTLINNPAKFWYFNNGITLVADTIKKNMKHGTDKDFGDFMCDGISVVNGAQTVATIGRYSNMPLANIDDVYVPIRVISLENSPEEFGKNITRTNNRQNKIENRDFVVLDPLQEKLKRDLSIEGIEYHVSRSDNFEAAESSFDLTEATTALACASGNGKIVVQLKREIGKLWEDIETTPYKALFNSSITGDYIWRCVKVQRKIDMKLNSLTSSYSDREAGILTHGNRIISALVFTQIPNKYLKNVKTDISDYLKENEITELVELYSARLIHAVSENFEDSTVIPTLFKNRKKCEKLLEACSEDGDRKRLPRQLKFKLFE